MIPYRHDRKRKSSIQGQANGNIHKADGIKKRRRRPTRHPSIFHTRIHIFHIICFHPLHRGDSASYHSKGRYSDFTPFFMHLPTQISEKITGSGSSAKEHKGVYSCGTVGDSHSIPY